MKLLSFSFLSIYITGTGSANEPVKIALLSTLLGYLVFKYFTATLWTMDSNNMLERRRMLEKRVRDIREK